jgi:hypothetical protein
MASLISAFAPLFIKAIDYWIEKKINDAEVAYRWQLFKNTMQNKGFISGQLKSDYDRQLQELEKRGPDS